MFDLCAAELEKKTNDNKKTTFIEKFARVTHGIAQRTHDL